MTDQERRELLSDMLLAAGCEECECFGGDRCRVCPWSDAMECVDAFYEKKGGDTNGVDKCTGRDAP